MQMQYIVEYLLDFHKNNPRIHFIPHLWYIHKNMD